MLFTIPLVEKNIFIFSLHNFYYNFFLFNFRKIDEIEKLEQLDELAKMENSIMELLTLNDQQARMESISTIYNRLDNK